MVEPVEPPAGPPLAVGRTAAVYAWGEAQVLKLFPTGYAESAVEHEAQIGRIVVDAGVQAPPVGGVITVGGRRGILYGRIDGVSMLAQLSRRPWTVGSLARTFGELHAAMHAVHRPQLPARRVYFERAIQSAPALTPAVRAAVLGRLEALADGNAICHGDYHPDNIILSRAGPVVIDWVTAGCGNPDADVARTVFLLGMGEILNVGSVRRGMITLLRRLFLNVYLRSYRAHRSCPPAAVRAWLPVIAAARLNEGIIQETDRLVALAEQAQEPG
jgi:aminoglycoside phosphotransferase (APT) family kinase protein